MWGRAVTGREFDTGARRPYNDRRAFIVAFAPQFPSGAPGLRYLRARSGRCVGEDDSDVASILLVTSCSVVTQRQRTGDVPVMDQ